MCDNVIRQLEKLGTRHVRREQQAMMDAMNRGRSDRRDDTITSPRDAVIFDTDEFSPSHEETEFCFSGDHGSILDADAIGPNGEAIFFADGTRQRR